MTSRIDETALIEQIYAALLGEATWQDFLDRLTVSVPGCWSVLHVNDVANAEAQVGLVSGRSAEDVADYPTYYHGISPWAQYCVVGPTGQAVVVEEHVPANVLEASEFYSDFLRPIETRSAIGMGVDGEGGRSLIVSLMTPGAAEEDLLPLAKQMTRISPHLQRAGEFYRRTSFASQTTEMGGTFFDALHLGMVVVGHGRTIRSASGRARQMFGRDVGIDPIGRIRLADQTAQTILDSMLRKGYQGPMHHRFLVGQTLVRMVRMTGERERSLFEGPGVCLTLEPLSQAGAVFDIEQFARGYGLSAAEVRVLSGLIAGKSLTEIAVEVSRSRETIRSQLKSLCVKTGSKGQSDLLRLVSGMRS